MPHDDLLTRLRLLWEKAQQQKDAANVSSDDIDRQLAVELANIRSEITKQDVFGISPEIFRTPVNVSSDMELEGIIVPYTSRLASGQIDSSDTGDTVLLTGDTNKIFEVLAVLAYKVVGTTQAWRFELDTGSSFATTRRISPTDTNDKETQGQKYILTAAERIVINVTGAVASSTIDWVIFYRDVGFGTVWQV